MKMPVELLPGGFDFPIWPELDESITREEVQDAISSETWLETPFDTCPTIHLDENGVFQALGAGNLTNRQRHVSRIAYLVVHGWEDAICINAQPGHWPVLDGNHRLTAAHFRGDETIEAEFDGFEADIVELFGPKIAAEAVAEWDDQ